MSQENIDAGRSSGTISTALTAPALPNPGLPARTAGEQPKVVTAARPGELAKAEIANVTSRRFGRIWYVPTAAIHPGPTPIRKRLASEDLQALANSIREKGMAQPVLLRVRRGTVDQFDLIAGYRRWQAAMLANMNEIPAIVIDRIGDREAFEFALVENLQRRDLTVIEEAEALRLMIDGYGRTHEQVAALTGRSRSHISNILRILSLPQEVKEMIESGRISFGHARALLAARSPVQLAARIADERLTVRETERLAHAVDATVQATPAAPASSPGPEALMTLEAEIARELGSIVEIKLDGKRPTIRIHTRSPQEAAAAARTIRDALQLLGMNRAMKSLGGIG
jgi:ParB family transcriptional regulator, chromosome partitioning protein